MCWTFYGFPGSYQWCNVYVFWCKLHGKLWSTTHANPPDLLTCSHERQKVLIAFRVLQSSLFLGSFASLAKHLLKSLHPAVSLCAYNTSRTVRTGVHEICHWTVLRQMRSHFSFLLDEILLMSFFVKNCIRFRANDFYIPVLHVRFWNHTLCASSLPVLIHLSAVARMWVNQEFWNTMFVDNWTCHNSDTFRSLRGWF